MPNRHPALSLLRYGPERASIGNASTRRAGVEGADVGGERHESGTEAGILLLQRHSHHAKSKHGVHGIHALAKATEVGAGVVVQATVLSFQFADAGEQGWH